MTSSPNTRKLGIGIFFLFSPKPEDNLTQSTMGDSAPTITSKQSLILDLPPSCIEFCSTHPSYFVVGTYNLVKEEETKTESSENADGAVPKKSQNRNGSLVVYQLVGGLV